MRLLETCVNRLLRALTFMAIALILAPLLPAQNATSGTSGPSGDFTAYLPAGSVSTKELIGAPPDSNSPRRIYDQAMFLSTRAAANTPRWTLAVGDSGRGVLKGFSCSAGVALDGHVPALVKLLTKLRTDLINLTKTSVDPPVYAVPIASTQGALCIEPKSGVAMRGEYPSLQSAWGWAIAMLLAEALPARANDLYRRGRAYGDSALICGTAWASAVSDGRAAAGALLARLRADQAFAADYAIAKKELGALSKSDVSDQPQDCAAEAAAIASMTF